MQVILVNDVSWRRGDKWILDHVDWTVEPGQHWVIVGANGSGKSTLLNVIAGYIWPTAGQVTVLGERFGACDLREMRKSIGWVTSALAATFQESRPYETAHDVVLSGRFASVGVYDEVDTDTIVEADELLGQFGIDRLRDQPFRSLSQGERQRVLLARAWMARPQILILDEPCTGLDILAREQLLSSLAKMVSLQQAPTILYVTHHVEETLPLFTHTLLVAGGRILAAGEKEHVLQSAHVSRALGVPVDISWLDGRPWARVMQSM